MIPTNAARIAAMALAGVLALEGAALADARRYKAPTGKPTESAFEEARSRYSAGNRAVQAGRWSDALADSEIGESGAASSVLRCADLGWPRHFRLPRSRCLSILPTLVRGISSSTTTVLGTL